MMSSESVVVTVELDQDQAMALAQLVKRVGFGDVRVNAVDDLEAYLMLGAISKLQDSLSGVGFSPR